MQCCDREHQNLKTLTTKFSKMMEKDKKVLERKVKFVNVEKQKPKMLEGLKKKNRLQKR